MRFKIQRESLLRPLQQISGIVERRQTMPVLANVLIRCDHEKLSFCATDLEIELVIQSEGGADTVGSCTLPARKLLDICRSLPDGIQLDVNVKENQGVVTAHRSRFTLASLPSDGFPVIEQIESHQIIKISSQELKSLLSSTAFAMAQQDVRFYLNGVLLEIKPGTLTAVATDGHRLAYNETACSSEAKAQVIVPRKAVTEMLRLLPNDETEVMLALGSNHLRLTLPGLRFTTKLIDARYPEYQRVMPKDLDKHVTVDTESLKQALMRASILSNEKFRGVRLMLQPGVLKLQSQNMEQEKADEELEIDYQGEPIETGFNVNYLLDYINAVDSKSVHVQLKDARSSMLMKADPKKPSAYVLMPMQL